MHNVAKREKLLKNAFLFFLLFFFLFPTTVVPGVVYKSLNLTFFGPQKYPVYTKLISVDIELIRSLDSH